MATTFHVTNFKNKLLDMLTGVSASGTPFGYVNFYNGAQPADPSVTPVGAAEFSSVSYGPNINTRMGSAGQGVTQLATPTAPSTPAQAAGVSSLSFARLFTTSQTPLMDVVVTTAGGGGGMIIDSTTSTAGVGTTITAFSFKIPTNLGTIYLSQSLADRLADLWGGAASVTPNMGNITGGGCSMFIYSGSAPANADAPATGSLLATFNMTSTNLWAAASGGASALNGAGPTVTASGTGTAAYFRMVKSNGLFTFTMQGTVGTASADILLNTTALTSGVTSVQIVDATITV